MLVHLIVLRQTGFKPLDEPMMAYLIDAYASRGFNELTITSLTLGGLVALFQ